MTTYCDGPPYGRPTVIRTLMLLRWVGDRWKAPLVIHPVLGTRQPVPGYIRRRVMRKITVLFLTTVILLIGMPGFSPTSAAVKAAPQDGPPEAVCQQLEKLLDGAPDLTKSLSEISFYLRNSVARTGAGSGSGKIFSDLFKNASAKLDSFLKSYGMDVTDFTTGVAWGPMSMARKLALLRLTNPTLTPLLVETIEAFIRDYIEQGYSEEGAQNLAERLIDAVDVALNGLPGGVKIGAEVLLKGLIELIKECRKQREAQREQKPRDTVGDRGNGDKQGKLGPPNDNHGNHGRVTVYCWVYGPIGVYEDGTVIYGYYPIPC